MDELQNIQSKIHVIRGHRVMLDSDIAGFYGVETKRLNEKVKRNPKRFVGEDFMFQLTQEEYDDLRLRSQNATLNKRKPIGFIQPEDDKNSEKEKLSAAFSSFFNYSIIHLVFEKWGNRL